jgi:hypothetical protein
MSVRRLLLLPAATVLFALAACGATTASSPGPTASAPSAAAPAATEASDCPSGTNLQKLVELPKGATFGGVECVQGWAGADLRGPSAGDGVYLFHYKAGTGWKYYGEGSGYDCKDLGLTEPAPFCIS